jgi:hypothetical protein
MNAMGGGRTRHVIYHRSQRHFTSPVYVSRFLPSATSTSTDVVVVFLLGLPARAINERRFREPEKRPMWLYKVVSHYGCMRYCVL